MGNSRGRTGPGLPLFNIAAAGAVVASAPTVTYTEAEP
jgi:hypothetical protein